MTRCIDRRAWRSAVMAMWLALAWTTSVHAETTTQINAGHALYLSKGCFECHGLAAQGAAMTGPPLAPHTPTLDRMQAYVRAPIGQMPLYSERILSFDELARIHAYLTSLPESRDVNSIALLATGNVPSSAAKQASVPAAAGDLAHGQAVFGTHCAACHGAQGGGGAGPSLRGIGSRLDLTLIEAQIRAPSGVMPSLFPGTIDAADVSDVARYVETLR